MRSRLFKLGFVLLFIFFLNACSVSSVEFTLQPTTSIVTIKGEDIFLKGTLDFKDSKNITFTLTEPESIKDITYCMSANENKVIIDNLLFSADKKTENSPVFLLLGAVKTIAASPVTIGTKGSENVILQSEKGEIVTQFNCDEGKINSIEYCGYMFML